MTLKLKLHNPDRARNYFEQKLAFTVGPSDVKYLLDKGENFRLIDVRSATDYDAGHIPGAVNLPQIEWQSLRGLDTDHPNIIYCYTHVCHLAARAALFFAQKGFPVMELEGGIEAWRDYEYAVEASPAAAEPAA